MIANADTKSCESPINSGRGGERKDGAKRRNSGGTLCSCDGAEIVTTNKWRRAGTEHDREVRILIELSKPQTGSNFRKDQSILLAVQDQTSNEQASCTRDLGVAQIVLLCEKFDVSTRTFALSIAIYDMFVATSGAQHSFQNPAACFILACKYLEIFAPRLIDVCSVMSHPYTSEDLRNAENDVLDILRFDIGIVTGDKPNPSVAPHTC